MVYLMFKKLFEYNNFKKIVLIAGALILGIIIILIIPKSKADLEGIAGRFYIFIQQYDKGIALLDNNPSHSSNFETIIKAKYSKGQKAYKKEDYYNAQLVFSEILSYKHSKIWHDDSLYQIGKIYYSNKLYKDSLSYFEKIEDYSDSYIYMMLCRDSLYNLQDFNNFALSAYQQYEIYKVFSQLEGYADVEKRLEDNKYILAKLGGAWEEKSEKKLNFSLDISEEGVSLNHNFTLPGGIKNDARIIIKDNVIALGLSDTDNVPIFKVETVNSTTLELYCYGNNIKYTLVKK